MNLTITQDNSRTETINSSIIDKLYEIAFAASSDPNSTVSLTGRLESPKGYKVKIDWLNTNFSPDLTITVPTSGQYILFQDSAVEAVLVAGGFSTDGVGITLTDAANATFTSSTFQGNTDITSFNTFDLFTKANTNPPNQLFKGCSSLREIDLSETTTIAKEQFYGCSNVTGVLDLPNLVSLGQYAFYNTGITSIADLGTINNIPERCFSGCTSLTSVTLPSTCLTINQEGFRNCSSLTTLNAQNIKTITGVYSLGGLTMSNLVLPAIETIGQRSLSGSNINVLDLGPNLSSIGTQAFWDGTYTIFIFRGTTVPSYNTTNTDKFLYNMNNVTIYVPESAINDYKTAWSAMASNIVKIEGSIYDTQ